MPLQKVFFLIFQTDTGSEQKWVIFDGPIDNSWVENLSSVMDDNSVLNLTNGERISIPDQVTTFFFFQMYLNY